MSQSVLVVAAHPDDEALGCGATLAKLASQGAKTHVAFLADGVRSRGAQADAGLPARRAAARRACDILGVQTLSFGDFADNRMDSVALLDVVQCVEALIAEHQPELVLTHHGADLNIDHQRVHQAVVTACRPQPGHGVGTLLFFEVPSSTEWQIAAVAPFIPNWFEDVTAFHARKMQALRAYGDEMRAWPHARSLEAVDALARWRGATVGVAAAEAFMLGRRRV